MNTPVPAPVARVLLVESIDERLQRMTDAVASADATCRTVDSHRAALAALREELPDLMMAGRGLRGGPLKDLVEVTHAGWPMLPVVCVLPEARDTEAADLLDAGGFDVVGDRDDDRHWRASVRRALADARARASVAVERGRILGAQTRLAAMAPAVDEMLVGLAELVHQAVGRPDISLRSVEMVCVRAMSRFLDGAVVVSMAYEGEGILRPRACSHPSEQHDHAAEHGFLLTEDDGNWREALAAVSKDEDMLDLVCDTYEARQCHLEMIGPPQEPFGAAAFLTQAAHPPSPEEVELLHQITGHAAHCIRVARQFRLVLRRYAAAQP